MEGLRTKFISRESYFSFFGYLYLPIPSKLTIGTRHDLGLLQVCVLLTNYFLLLGNLSGPMSAGKSAQEGNQL